MTEKRSNKLRIIFYSIIVVLLAIGGVSYYYLTKPAPHIHVKLKDIKPGNLELDYLAGASETIENIKKKGNVLMVFFTLNCPETKANIEDFNELNKRDDLAVVGYMMSGTSRAQKFAKNYNVDFPLVKASKHYMKTFEPNTTPTMYLVRIKDMKPRDKYVGRIINNKVIKKIKNTF